MSTNLGAIQFDRIANYAARRGISLANTLIDIHIPGRLDDIGSVSVLCSRALAERVNVDDALASIRVRPITPEHLRRLAEAHEANDHDEVRHASINEVLGLAASGHLFVTGGPEEALVFFTFLSGR
ncbi:MAG: hypothetical protein KL863_26875 [Rhizobium sp.]|nr:hypothetical protein [Rhizobium sp.]